MELLNSIHVRIQMISLVILASSCDVCFCRNKTINELYRYLFNNYNSDARPVYNQSDAINVTSRVVIRSLLNLDAREQIYTLGTYLKMTWNDQFLTWNPADFDGIDICHAPIDRVWSPDITLHDNADVGFERYKPGTLVQIYPDGTIIWFVPVIYTTTCIIRVKWFPFDFQVCEMKFGSWAYDGFQVDLHAENSLDANSVRYLANGVWDMVYIRITRTVVTYLCCPEPYPELLYRILFKRNSEYYVYYMVLPCVFLSILSLLVFYLPPECGEKLTLSITNLLALVVFQQVIATTMPPSSEESPIIGIYFMCMIVMVCLSVFATVLVMHLSAISQPVPRWVQRIFLDIIPRMLCLSREHTAGSILDTTGAVPVFHNPEAVGQLETIHYKDQVQLKGITTNSVSQFDLKELEKIADTLSYIKKDVDNKNAQSLEHLKWRRVSIIIDRVLLYIFSLFVIVCTLLLTCQIILGSKDAYETALLDVKNNN